MRPELKLTFYPRFLIAHECAHHVYRHLTHLGRAEVFGIDVLNHMLRQAELDADCFATKALREHDIEAVRSAQWVFDNSAAITSASHPSGMERVSHIELCLHQQ
ncbi:M48 family metalloprotease [Roseibium algae]|uniref:M48 family metalloprotease n=1 Tax=Roseibium algae TaxID=3123038 RepID=A0ABU8TPL7_9HYPH